MSKYGMVVENTSKNTEKKQINAEIRLIGHFKDFYMIKQLSLSCFFIILLMISCAASPVVVEDQRPLETGARETGSLVVSESSSSGISLVSHSELVEEQDLNNLPDMRIIPPVPEMIMGKGRIGANNLAAFLLQHNPGIERIAAEYLSQLYTQEAAIEGVNHDVSFAQMCLETGFLHFGGLVTPDMNNFCGLGATGPGYHGEKFPSPRIGVRAHIQHLKAYATDEPLEQDLVDPRFYYVRFGSSPAIKGLAGTWAADLLYADKIKNILERLYRFSFSRMDIETWEIVDK